jgi:uncharacterized membrane protein YtjA (UPF0391 family)
MLIWAFVFLFLAIVAGYFGFGQAFSGRFGFGETSQTAISIAMWFFWSFITLFFIIPIIGVFRKSKK